MLIVGIIIYIIGVVVAAILNGYLISILDEDYNDLVSYAIFSLLSWIDALYVVSYIIIIKTINYSNKLKEQNGK